MADGVGMNDEKNHPFPEERSIPGVNERSHTQMLSLGRQIVNTVPTPG